MSVRSSPSSSAEAAHAAAVVVAAGAGLRLGGAVRKQFLELAGEPVLLRALRPFLDHPAFREVVVVLPAEDAAAPPDWLRALPVRVVAGGAERGDSVRNGLMAVGADSEVVLIHDGARPLLTADVIDRVLAAAVDGGAIAAVPVTDTIQEVDEGGVIVRTPDRARLWQAQTPQGFPRAAILAAYQRSAADGFAATDDAAVYQHAGGAVRVVMGSHRNLKITRPDDLALAEALLRGAAS